MNKPASNNFKSKVTAEEFNELLSTTTKFESFEVTTPLELNAAKRLLELDSCSFINLSIAGNVENLRIINCSFKNLVISAKIKKLEVLKVNDNNAKISIKDNSISEIIFNDNKKIKKLEINKNQNIQRLKFYGTCIDMTEIYADVTSVRFYGGNNHHSISIKGRVFDVVFENPTNSNRYSKSVYAQIYYQSQANNSQLSLSNSTVEGLSFEDCRSLKRIKIWNATIKHTMFSNCQFESDGKISISGCQAETLIIQSSKIPLLTLYFSDLRNTIIYITSSILEEINWQSVRWSNKIEKYDGTGEGQLETLRVLKVNAKRQLDKFNVLLFSTLENEVYRKKLNRTNGNNGDKLILWLNHISNNHGQSPWKGVAFTLIVCALFFFSGLLFLNNSYWQWGWSNWSDFWTVADKTLELYSKALYAAHSFDYLKMYQPRGIVFVLDLIGRIFVAYGYYQTIMAFRKFNRE